MIAKLLIALSVLSLTSAAPYVVRLRRSLDAGEQQQSDDVKIATSSRGGKALDFYPELQQSTKQQQQQQQRQNKALAYLDFLPQFFAADDDYGDDDLIIGANNNNNNNNNNNFEDDDEDISRTLPSRRKQQQNIYKDFSNSNALGYENSPIYYIRLPPTPYMFVPGLGYVSQPPQLGPPPPPSPPRINPFINLPLDFVANGKPTTIYQWSDQPAAYQPYDPYRPQRPQQPSRPNTYQQNSYHQRPLKKPLQDSKITNLNKGPYPFNGKPTDIFVLRDSYNSLYSDALQNFYP